MARARDRRSEGMAEGSDEDVSIVFIEDDEDIAEMYKLKLEMDGYRVTVSQSGEDGVEVTADLLPDIVFLDIRLPKMDGSEVLERLRADPRTKEIPVVILSAYDFNGLRDRGLQLSVREFLIRSETTPGSLSARVQDWLGRSAQESTLLVEPT